MTTLHVDEDAVWREALAGLRGEVVELGCGDGRTFPWYPPGVTGVHAFEPDPSLRHDARGVAAWTATPVWVRDDPVEDLPLARGSIDGAVLRLLLHRRPAAPVVAELARVLRFRGELVILEDAGPDPLAAVRAGGFTVEDTWSVRHPTGMRVLGRAVR
ncbi:methyltransferase domain-containing protein [Actinomycetospora lutea]|uniref:class I SAM-dependent methyltransferase n=1 Tax=Actinomycetospora lutea TaxID=663604 RepID=UPI002365B0B0|nr:methyltransferase domain-containing protein [Actinomycetospora lutea]MDD7941030.1 methyltransferase domain-containing protein [Actinomycetospora lutea]